MLTQEKSCGSKSAAPSARPQKDETRRMALLTRAGFFGTDMSGAAIERACSAEDLIVAYRLVHEVFVGEGYIERICSGLRLRVYEALPETATFVAKIGADVVGVQSVVPDSRDLKLPSDSAFGEELDRLREGGRILCEAANEAVAPEFRKTAVASELMRCCFAHAVSVGCDELITTVSPGHARFYELLGFRRVSPIRSYSATRDDPTTVVALDVTGLAERFRDVPADDKVELLINSYYRLDNPYNPVVAQWAAFAEERFRDPELLVGLLTEGEDFLAACSNGEIQAIRRRWGEQLYQQVVGSVRRQLVPV